MNKRPGHLYTNKQGKSIDKLVCNYINKKYLVSPTDQDGNPISQNNYASLIGISSSVLTKMKEEGGYRIPLSTIFNICQNENITLTEFFSDFERLNKDNL